jgi:hypothetical protein
MVIVPALMVELCAPPLGWAGGVSSVVPCTVITHGAEGNPAAEQVAGSLTETPTFIDVSARKSAVPPPGDGNELMSMIRNLSRVTGAPVLFWKRLRTDNVPNVAFRPVAAGSRNRLGAVAGATV